MSESSSSTPSREHDESSTDEPSAAEVLCTLGSLTGEHTIDLSQMTSQGEPIPEAPHITIWTDEPNPDDNNPLATGVSTLISSPKDDDYPPFIVKVQAPHHQWFDYSDVPVPDGLKAEEADDETRLWFGRFDTLGESIEVLVKAADQLSNVSRAD